MKKSILLTGVLVLTLAFTACDTNENNNTIHVESVSVSSIHDLYVGDTFTVGTQTVTIEPSDASIQTYTLESDNTDVFTVDGYVITAVGLGEAKLTVITDDGGLTDWTTINVIEKTDTGDGGDNNPNNPDDPNTGDGGDNNPDNPNTGDGGGTGDDGDDGDKDTEPGPAQGSDITGEHFLGIDYSDGVYYFDGEVYSSFYGEVTQDVTKAVIVTVEEVAGGYTLSFEDDGTTQYIQMAENDNHRNFVWGEDPYTWTYEETYETFITTDSGGTTYYIGTYSTFVEMALNKYGYLTGEIDTEYDQYPAHLYDVVTLTAPTSITITGENEVEEGSRITLTATVDEGTNPNVTWSSDNTGVATVSDTGVVTGVAEGSANITATSIAAPSVYATVSITVKARTTEVPEDLIGTYDFTALGRTSDNTSADATAITEAFSTAYIAGNEATNPLTTVGTVSHIALGAGGTSDGNNTGMELTHDCLKLGSKNNAGELVLTFSTSISKVIITAMGWGSTNGILSINSVSNTITENSATLTSADDAGSYTYTLGTSSTTLDLLTASNGYRVLIFTMELYS